MPSSILGRKIYSLEEVDSTNSYASRLAAEGEPEGAVVIAEYQSAGRGRLGRTWVSPRGVNICMSVLLRPAIPPREAPLVTLAAGAALARSVNALYGLDAKLKWPNDLLIGGRKAAGILTEMSAGPGLVRHIVLGVGVDVNMECDSFPAEIRDVSTSIMVELGSPVDRAALIGKFLEELEQVYGLLVSGDRARVLELWRACSCTLGQMVSVKTEAGVKSGRAVDVDETGRLVLDAGDGRLETVVSGELGFI